MKKEELAGYINEDGSLNEDKLLEDIQTQTTKAYQNGVGAGSKEAEKLKNELEETKANLTKEAEEKTGAIDLTTKELNALKAEIEALKQSSAEEQRNKTIQNFRKRAKESNLLEEQINVLAESLSVEKMSEFDFSLIARTEAKDVGKDSDTSKSEKEIANKAEEKKRLLKLARDLNR